MYLQVLGSNNSQLKKTKYKLYLCYPEFKNYKIPQCSIHKLIILYVHHCLLPNIFISKLLPLLPSSIRESTAAFSNEKFACFLQSKASRRTILGGSSPSSIHKRLPIFLPQTHRQLICMSCLLV